MAETKSIVRTEDAPGPFQGAPYSQAIRAGGFVFVSGQLGLKLGDEEISGSIAEQTEQIFVNLRAILEAAGSGLDRLVKTTVYLVDLSEFGAMRRGVRAARRRGASCTRDRRGGGAPSGARVEIEAIAASRPQCGHAGRDSRRNPYQHRFRRVCGDAGRATPLSGSVVCLAGSLNRNVREFYRLHADELDFVVDASRLELDAVRRLIVVETVHAGPARRARATSPSIRRSTRSCFDHHGEAELPGLGSARRTWSSQRTAR